MARIKGMKIETRYKCGTCGSPLVVKGVMEEFVQL